MTPSVGRIVHVRLNAAMASAIGGNAREGDLAPAIIVMVWTPETINARILGDGPGDVIWGSSLQRGDELSNWNWPKMIEQAHAEGE